MSKADGQCIVVEFTEKLVNSQIVGSAHRTLDDATITALNNNGSSYSPSKLNDGVANTSYYWIGTTAINWIKIAFKEAKVAHGFRWYIGSSTYYPKTFTVSGSNDGANWVQLGDTFTGTSATGWQEFAFTNTTAYIYYKIDILTANSSQLYISEVELLLDYGNEAALTITGKEYNMQPGGTLDDGSYKVQEIKEFKAIDKMLDLSGGTMTNVEYTNGVLSLEVDGG